MGPDVFLNTKIHKKFGSHNGSLTQSMHQKTLEKDFGQQMVLAHSEDFDQTGRMPRLI